MVAIKITDASKFEAGKGDEACFFNFHFYRSGRLDRDERSEIHCLRRLDLRGEGVEVLRSKVCTVRPRECVPFKCELLEIFSIF